MSGVHTPGPWAIGIETSDEMAQVIAADGSHIAYVECDPVLSNARLIAAAPAIYAALQAAADAMGRFAVQYAHRMSENEAREMTCASYAARNALALCTTPPTHNEPAKEGDK
jgi:hypothetical protein